MEKYIDEDILQLIKESNSDEKGKYGKVGSIEHKIIKDIEKGAIKLDEDELIFDEKLILDEKLSVLIPESFEEMSKEDAKIKYASPEIPKIIFTSECGSVNFTFDHIEAPFYESMIEEAEEELFEMVKFTYPEAKFFDNGIRSINGKKVVFLDFTSSAPDGEIYNLMFLMELQKRPLMASFNCLQEDMDLWKAIFIGVMNAIKVH